MSTDATTVAQLRDAVGEPDPGEIEALQRQLADRADRDGLLDVAYRTLDSPVGVLLVAATSVGLVRVAFEGEGHDAVLGELAREVSPRILRSDRRTDAVAVELDEYFAGDRRRFELPVDLRLVHGFRAAVITHLPEIPYGETESYADVARAAGRPAAVRAVGTACGHNPVPIVVPCHRVVRSDGTIGQYRGGVEAKTTLLALEAAR
jgi:methylated-DNA-[protein]-cysteine S-methyltransferase